MGRILMVDTHQGLCASLKAKREQLMKTTGLQIPDAVFAGGNIYKMGTKMPDGRGNIRSISRGEYQACMHELLQIENYLALMELLPGAGDELLRLSTIFDEIHLVSNARGVTDAHLQGIVDKFDLPINKVVPTYGDADLKRELYRKATAVIDNESEFLSGLGKRGIIAVRMLPAQGEIGYLAINDQDPDQSYLRARGWPEAATMIAEEMRLAA